MAPGDFLNTFTESEAAELWRVSSVLEAAHAVDGPSAQVLDADVELLELVSSGQRDAARLASRAAVLELARGAWDGHGHPGGGYGLIVLAGVLLRRVDHFGRSGAEVLAAGDLLPAAAGGHESAATRWRVLVPARLAVLDQAWNERMGRFTRIGPALAARSLERSARLGAMMAITQVPRLDERLWRLLWELADRHGRVHPDGVHLDLPLTHDVLGLLAGARRPPVTAAITRLAAQGRVRRDGREWVLTGAPPTAAA